MTVALEQGPAPAPGTRATGDVRRCVSELVPIGAAATPDRAAFDGRVIAIIGGDERRRAAVGRAVIDHGGRVVLIGAEDDPGRIVQSAGGADALVDLNLVHSDQVRVGAWREPLNQTYAALRAVAPRWSAESRTGRHAYLAVTAFGGRLGTDPAAVRQPLSGIWAGLAKTLPRELPTCDIHVVDVDDEEDLGTAVVTELAARGFAEIGWWRGRRHVLLPRQLETSAPVAGLPAGSLVVLSGGGRGIGYHLARRLRRQFDCRVVVTGRLDLAEVPTGLLTAPPDWFHDYRQDRLRSASGAAEVRAVRRELDRLARARELSHNLSAACLAGEELEYRSCDVTDAQQVATLLGGFDQPLAAMVHDAGVDRPVRLARSTAEDVHAVVSVKVDGFLNLLQALDRRPAGVLCAVGSLTGRYGGTAGQTSYAAANEGLARLVGWAGRTGGSPAISLAWPTWDAVGLITDHRAAVREMAALPVQTGVTAWVEELCAPRGGETLFLAELGALSPAEVRSIPVPSNHPLGGPLLGRRNFLGEVEAFVPSTLLRTRHHIDELTLPAIRWLSVDGRPGIPVSVIAEWAVDTVHWLAPGPARPVRAAAIRALQVNIGTLAVPAGGALVLTRMASARPDGDDWSIDVQFFRDDDGRPTMIAAATVSCVHDLLPFATGVSPGAARRADRAHLELPTANRPITWRPEVALFGASGPARHRLVWAEQASGQDLLGQARPIEPRLPIGVLEALFWAARPATATGDATVELADLMLGGGDQSRCTDGWLDHDGSGGAMDEDSRVVFGVSGLRWHQGRS